MIKRYLAKRDNPWELLVIAAMFLAPGVVLLLQRQPFFYRAPTARMSTVRLWSPSELHVLGWFGVIVAAGLVVLYFYARVAIEREEQAPPPHFLGS